MVALRNVDDSSAGRGDDFRIKCISAALPGETVRMRSELAAGARLNERLDSVGFNVLQLRYRRLRLPDSKFDGWLQGFSIVYDYSQLVVT